MGKFALKLFYAELNLLSVNIPFFFVACKRLGGNLVCKNVGGYFLTVIDNSLCNDVVACASYTDVVNHLKACLLTHGLELAYDFTDKSLLNKLGSESGIKSYGNALIREGVIALLLLNVDKKVLLKKLNGLTVVLKGKLSFGVKLTLCGRAVNIRKPLTDSTEVLTVLGTYGLELRLEGIGDKATSSINSTRLTLSSSVIISKYFSSGTNSDLTNITDKG